MQNRLRDTQASGADVARRLLVLMQSQAEKNCMKLRNDCVIFKLCEVHSRDDLEKTEETVMAWHQVENTSSWQEIWK